MSIGTYALIGIVTVAILGWLLGWLVPKLIGNSIDSRFAKKERAEQEYRKEQIEDALMQQRGQQVMSDCLHEILRHMITGDHIDDLEAAQRELEAFRDLNRESLMRKAAKYNLR